MAADAAMVVVAMVTAFVVRAAQGGPDIDGAMRTHLLLGIVAVPLWLGLLARHRLYNARFIVRRVEELRRIGRACVSAALVLAAAGYVAQLPVSRAWLLNSAATACILLGTEREIARGVFAWQRRKGRMMRDVVIVGSNIEARELAEMLSDDPTLGYRIVGFVSDDDAECRDDLLGAFAETIDIVRRTGATGVILAASATSVAVSNPLVRDLVRAGIHVELSSTLRDVAPERLTVRPLGRVPVVYLEPPRTGGWRSVAKRAFDLAVTGVVLVLVAPVCLGITIAIRLDSAGPVIFRQTRVGKNGEPFLVRKFRTMVPDAEDLIVDLRDRNEADGPLFKLRDDPRVTRVGKLLRRSSLDELPQLVNVLRGEMSMVGPRPALPDELHAWDPQLHDRLRVKPGITGMWQVSGRSDSTFESYGRLDLYYVDNWSLVTDLAILAKTVPTVLFRRGAY
jgi:exopolysaccharide biosynthesis polyprenyl glycosylphosphotransferase